MMKPFHNFFSSPLGRICFGKKSHVLIFGSVIFLNLCSALMEGTSFGLLLASFSVLDGSAATMQKSLGLFGGYAQILCSHLPQGQEFLYLALLAVLAQIFRSAFAFLGQVVNTYITTKIQIEAQQNVYAQIFRFSFPHVSNYKLGDLVEYAKSPATVISIVLEAANRSLVSAMDCLACITIMFCLSPHLAFLALLVFGVFGLLLKKIIHKISRVSCSLTERLVEFSKHVVQSLYGLRAIFIFDRQVNTMEKIKSTLGQVAHLTQRVGVWNSAIGPINEIMNVMLVGVFLIVGHSLTQSGGLGSVSLLLTFITIVYRLGTRLQIVITSVGTIAMYWGGVQRLKEILSVEGKEFADRSGKPFTGSFQKIVFNDVTFQYKNSGVVALKNVHFTIPHGATIALVGASGAGKSSVIDLLVRLFEPTSGCIQIDNHSLREYEVGSWRNILGVVSQDSFMFNETIEDNIRFGRLNASFEEIRQAAQIAGAHEFIMRLPHQYQSIIGERGCRLSGGERQRISLTRALVRNPEILILDEATSSLDSRSERFIQDALKRLHGQKTIIAVAHRLSTIAMADVIYVLEGGEIVEAGAHAELLRLGGHYARYWNIQAAPQNL